MLYFRRFCCLREAVVLPIPLIEARQAALRHTSPTGAGLGLSWCPAGEGDSQLQAAQPLVDRLPAGTPVVGGLHLEGVAAGMIDELAGRVDKPRAKGALLLAPGGRVGEPAQPYGQVIGEGAHLPQQGVRPEPAREGRYSGRPVAGTAIPQ